MPVLRSIRERFAPSGRSTGVRVGGVPARHGRDGEPRAHAGRRRRRGRAVRGQPARHAGRRRRGARRRRRRRGPRAPRRGLDAYAATSPRSLDARPQITLDDGADLVSTMHAAGTELLRRHPRRHRGDDDRRSCGCARSRPTGSSACPVLAVNEARTERAVQQPLRHRPVGARRDPARDEPAARRAHRRRARLRLVRAGDRAARARRRRGGGRLRGRPGARARGAHGGLRGDARRSGGRARRRASSPSPARATSLGARALRAR